MSSPLLNSPADILRWLLVSLGGLSDPLLGSAWPGYVAAEPTTPDNCVTLYDTSPEYHGRSQVDGESFRHWGIQVRVRAKDFPTGVAKVQSLKHTLDEVIRQNSVTINSNVYCVQAVNKTIVLSIGQDTPTSKRYLFTINCTAYVELSS